MTLRMCGVEPQGSFFRQRILRATRLSARRASRLSRVFDPLILVDHVASWGPSRSLTPQQLRDRALVLLRVDSLCRSGEPAYLRLADVILSPPHKMTLSFTLSKDSSIALAASASSATPPITIFAARQARQCAVRALDAWLSWMAQRRPWSDSDLIFRRVSPPFAPLSADRVSTLVKGVMRAAGIPAALRSSDVRGAAASKAFAAGASLAEVMYQGRWSSSSSLMQHYNAAGALSVDMARLSRRQSSDVPFSWRLRAPLMALVAQKSYNI
jgi:hypothetical protein